MIKSNDNKTNEADDAKIVIKRFNRLLSDIYIGASLEKYKSNPRHNSLAEADKETGSDVKQSEQISPPNDIRRISAAAAASAFQKLAAHKATHDNGLGRKLMYSRQLSRSTSFLPIAEANQKKVVYNWSGLHAIAREAQIFQPNNVNQLIRLVKTATSKVNLILDFLEQMNRSFFNIPFAMRSFHPIDPLRHFKTIFVVSYR